MLTSVYIDGFNLYYGALKRTRFKWLDLRRMVEQVFPNDDIGEIHYFTALVHPRPSNRQAPVRQRIYWRALQTIPGLTVHQGFIRTHTVRRELAMPIAGVPDSVTVVEPREKMTDVALASQLIVDASNRKFEQAVLVTNDADFVPAIRCVRNDFELDVAILNPAQKGRTQGDLEAAAKYVKRLRRRHIAASMLPETVTDAKGVFRKPSTW